jgi:hypothetical protein
MTISGRRQVFLLLHWSFEAVRHKLCFTENGLTLVHTLQSLRQKSIRVSGILCDGRDIKSRPWTSPIQNQYNSLLMVRC